MFSNEALPRRLEKPFGRFSQWRLPKFLHDIITRDWELVLFTAVFRIFDYLFDEIYLLSFQAWVNYVRQNYIRRGPDLNLTWSIANVYLFEKDSIVLSEGDDAMTRSKNHNNWIWSSFPGDYNVYEVSTMYIPTKRCFANNTIKTTVIVFVICMHWVN